MRQVHSKITLLQILYNYEPCLFAPIELICIGKTGRLVALKTLLIWLEFCSSDELLFVSHVWRLFRLKSKVSPNERSSTLVSSMTRGGSSWYGLLELLLPKLRDLRGHSLDSEDRALSLNKKLSNFGFVYEKFVSYWLHLFNDIWGNCLLLKYELILS
jgi:hypothetical protein